MNNLLGGTELQFKFLEKYVDHSIRCSVDLKIMPNSHRLTTDIDSIYDPKKTIVWTQQSYDFLEAKMISDQIKNINNVVFVSEWQKQKYIQTFDLPKEKCMVIPNGIEPATDSQKPKIKNQKINLIYFSTPYRGLDVLLDSLDYLQHHNYHLHVFSSMDIYGQWEENTKYEDLYNRCKRNHRITYHGSVPHDTILQALNDMHIMAYPCTFEETCCISALEAMSQKLKIVCSDLGALPETTAGFATMYTYTENKTEHAKIFAKHLDLELNRYQERNQTDQKLYVDNKHDWNKIKIFWNDLFKKVLRNNRIILNYDT